MFTRCPACHTLFRIQPKQLKAARGQVRCGSCQAVFDGLEFLVNREDLSKQELAALTKPSEPANRQWQLPFDDVPLPAQAETPESELEAPPSANTTARDENPCEAETSEGAPAVTAIESGPPTPAHTVIENEPVAPANVAAESEPATIAPIAAEALVENEPPVADKPASAIRWSPRYSLSSHEPAAATPRTSNRLGWSFGSLLLIAVLAGQLVWFKRDTLALDSRWRPWLQMVCDTAGCTLPPLRDPSAIEMVDRNVQTHPQFQGALLITATLVNQAPFAQPYPQVELSMTDLDQKRVAGRRFLPAEYLDNGNAGGLIAPGASVRLKLEIADPGQEAVGFEFEFL